MPNFQKVKLDDVVVFRTGKLNSNAAVENGVYPFFTCSQEVYKTNTYSFDTECILLGGNNASAIYPLFYFKGKFDAYQRTYIIETKNSNNIRFFYYVLRNKLEELRKQSTGATTKFLTLTILKNLEINIPDLKKQIQIASVLSTYDDLIENNEKRIKILEQMTQILYEEWFVKYKFPGHEKVKMVDIGSEFGMIPDGWEVKRLRDIGKAITGKTPSTSKSANFDGEILFIKTPDIHGNVFVLKTEQTLSEIGVKSQFLKLLPEKTVIVSCIGTLGVVGITSKPSQTNQQINALLLHNADDYCYFYLFAKSLKKQLTGLGSNGATMGNVNKDKFENICIIYPMTEIRKLFFAQVSRLFDEIFSLQKQNNILSKTRDLLIPQLVTGKRELK